MTNVRPTAAPPHVAARDGVTVRAPRACDAIGGALHHAFAPEQVLPDHLVRSLTALDARR